MLAVTCGYCGETFQVESDASIDNRICPHCGAANSISPDDFNTEPDDVPDAIGISHHVREPAHWVRKTFSIVLILMFVVTVIWMLSPDWEQQHFQEISGLIANAQSTEDLGNHQSAAEQFHAALAIAGNRPIHSKYLRQLLLQAKAGESTALAEIHAASSPAETQP